MSASLIFIFLLKQSLKIVLCIVMNNDFPQCWFSYKFDLALNCQQIVNKCKLRFLAKIYFIFDRDPEFLLISPIMVSLKLQYQISLFSLFLYGNEFWLFLYKNRIYLGQDCFIFGNEMHNFLSVFLFCRNYGNCSVVTSTSTLLGLCPTMRNSF